MDSFELCKFAEIDNQQLESIDGGFVLSITAIGALAAAGIVWNAFCYSTVMGIYYEVIFGN